MAVVTWKEDFNNLTNWNVTNPLGLSFGYPSACAYDIVNGKLAVGFNGLNQGLGATTGLTPVITGSLNSIRFAVKFNPRPDAALSAGFANRVIVIVRGFGSDGYLPVIGLIPGPEVRMAVGVDAEDPNVLQFQSYLWTETGIMSMGATVTRTVAPGDWVEYRLWRDSNLANVIYTSSIVNGVEVDLGSGAYDMAAFRLPDWPYGWGIHAVVGTGTYYPNPGDATGTYLDYLYLNDIGGRPNYTPNITGSAGESTTRFTGSR